MRKLAALTVFGFTAFMMLSCKPKDEKACEKLQKFVDNGKYSMEECKKDMEKVKKDCKNADAVFECLASKEKESDLKECEKKCEK
ncbi:MAG: hypothetical protein U0271_16720 [Polyangiaceae bacterium]